MQLLCNLVQCGTAPARGWSRRLREAGKPSPRQTHREERAFPICHQSLTRVVRDEPTARVRSTNSKPAEMQACGAVRSQCTVNVAPASARATQRSRPSSMNFVEGRPQGNRDSQPLLGRSLLLSASTRCSRLRPKPSARHPASELQRSVPAITVTGRFTRSKAARARASGSVRSGRQAALIRHGASRAREKKPKPSFLSSRAQSSTTRLCHHLASDELANT